MKTLRIPTNLFVGLAVLALPLTTRAASVLFDFNSDPSTSGLLTLYGNSTWQPSGGVGGATNTTDGYLSITDAINSQRGAIVFADFDAGSVVAGFTFDADFRIGNGTAVPADGFSINYCRANDPVLADVANGGNPATDGGMWACGPNCEDNLPEEGTHTGIGIGFDAWQSPQGGSPPPWCNGSCQTDPSYLGPDIVGLSVRVDGNLIAQFPMPTLNGACNDPTSLQTGPRDGTGDPSILCWQHLKVALTTNAQLSVFWKGVQLLTNYQTTYFPSPGRLVFTGRTGGANENHHVDNIAITTIPASVALVGAASGFPDGFAITINDSGSSVINTNAPITTRLNGSTVTPTSITKNGGTTTVTYHGFPTLLPVGSTNSVFVSASDSNGNTISGTRTFVVPPYGIVPAADAVTGVNTSLPGFRMLPWQSGAEPNAVYWMLEQLAGLHGTNNANLTFAEDNGYIDYSGVINFNIAPASAGGGDAGNFQQPDYPDASFPGIPGANGLTGSTAENIRLFLQFQSPGVYTLGVNSDDGFLVSEGKNADDWFANRLGLFNGGRGAADTTFTIAVANAGIYPFRLAWENGNGELPGNGANCEFFSVLNGVKYLINDPSPTNTTGIKAFYSGPALPAYVSAVQPNPGQNGVLPNRVFAQLTDESTSVVGGSIRLYVNGALTSPSVNKVGTTTSVLLAPAVNALLPAGPNNAALAWSDSAGTGHSNYWTFSVAAYATLDPSLAAPLGTEDTSQPGFMLHVVQIDFDSVNDPGDGIDNQVDEANAMIAGAFFPWYGTNVADPADGGNGGAHPAVSGNLWYWTNQIDFNTTGSAGDFANDYGLPGVPGTSLLTVNFAALFQTWIAFPTAGFYTFGVNSDDGFRLSEGFAPLRQVLHVTAPGGVDKDVGAVVSKRTDGNGGFGAAPPASPISAPVVFVNSNSWAGPPNPPPNVSGKVAVIDRALYGISDAMLAYGAQTNGALAAVLINQPANGFPFKVGGNPPAPMTIPVLCVSGFGGERDFWNTAGLVATIGASQAIQVGSADYGKGMSHVDFGFVVPQAGVYPMHMIYEQAGGGAGCELSQIQADGTRLLVNDPTAPGSLLAYRAVNFARPTISIARVGSSYQITFTGVLRSSTSVNGPYQPVAGATSPYTIPSTALPRTFYRASNQ